MNSLVHYHGFVSMGGGVIHCKCGDPPPDPLTPFQGYLMGLDRKISDVDAETAEKTARAQRLTVARFLVNEEAYRFSNGKAFLFFDWSSEMPRIAEPFQGFKDDVEYKQHSKMANWYIERIVKLIKQGQEGEL